MSIVVPIDELFEQVGEWGFGYLLTVGDDERAHLLALVPSVVGDGGRRALRFDAGPGRGSRNAAARPNVSVVFPPHASSDGYSLVVDGEASVEGATVDLRPTSALLHRPAP